MYSTIAPSEVASRNDKTPMFTPGGFYRTENGNVYIYVKRIDSTAPYAGQCAFWADDNTDSTGLYMVTADINGTAGQNAAAGVWTYGVSQNYYTFIQVGGICLLDTRGTPAPAANQAIIAANASCSSTTANWASVAAGTAPTNKVVAWSLAAESAAKTLSEIVLCR